MLLKLDGEGPLYTQVYAALRRHITQGRFAPGERLPGTRSVAAILGVSRTVVLLAYAQLESEGYTITRVGSGTFVNERAQRAERMDLSGEPGLPSEDIAERPLPASVPISRLAVRVKHAPSPEFPRDLLDGGASVIDLTAAAIGFDTQAVKAWRKALSLAMESLPTELPKGSGVQHLREFALDNLARYRGVSARLEDVIIVNSVQQARDLIARVLVDEHAVAGVEEPCDPDVRHAFVAAGGRVVACATDAEGADVDQCSNALREARVLHVSPACHVPTGTVMTAARRKRLLEWAYARPAYLVEEDFHAVPHLGIPAMPSLQGQDRHGRVIYYVNCLTPSVYPAMQVACIVVPPALREKFYAFKKVSDHDGVALRQHAWTRYLQDGDYERALRRLAQQLVRKHRVVVEVLSRLGAEVRVESTAITGQVLVHLPTLDAGWMTVLREEALRIGLLLESAAPWYQHPPTHVSLWLHYAALPENLVQTAIDRLIWAYHATLADVGRARRSAS